MSQRHRLCNDINAVTLYSVFENLSQEKRPTGLFLFSCFCFFVCLLAFVCFCFLIWNFLQENDSAANPDWTIYSAQRVKCCCKGSRTRFFLLQRFMQRGIKFSGMLPLCSGVFSFSPPGAKSKLITTRNLSKLCFCPSLKKYNTKPQAQHPSISPCQQQTGWPSGVLLIFYAQCGHVFQKQFIIICAKLFVQLFSPTSLKNQKGEFGYILSELF